MTDYFTEACDKVIKDIMIIDARLLFTADAAHVVTTKLHLARRLKVVIKRTLLSLHTEWLQLYIGPRGANGGNTIRLNAVLTTLITTVLLLNGGKHRSKKVNVTRSTSPSHSFVTHGCGTRLLFHVLESAVS